MRNTEYSLEKLASMISSESSFNALIKRAVMKYVEDPVSEFIISDRILQGRGGKGLPGPRTLRVGLTADKENTLVSLKTEPLGVTVK